MRGGHCGRAMAMSEAWEAESAGIARQDEPAIPVDVFSSHVKLMMELYPEHNKATLTEALETHDGDLHQAAEVLQYRRQAMKIAGTWVDQRHTESPLRSRGKQSNNKLAALTVYVSGLPRKSPSAEMRRYLYDVFEELQPPCTVIGMRMPGCDHASKSIERNHRGYAYVDLSATLRGMRAASNLALAANAGRILCGGAPITMSIEWHKRFNPDAPRDQQNPRRQSSQESTGLSNMDMTSSAHAPNSSPVANLTSRFTEVAHTSQVGNVSKPQVHGQSDDCPSMSQMSLDQEEEALRASIARFREKKEQQKRELAQLEEQERQLALRCQSTRKEKVIIAVNNAKSTLEELLARSNNDTDMMLKQKKAFIQSMFSSIRKQVDYREQVMFRSIDNVHSLSIGSLFAAKQALEALLNPKVLNGLANLDSDAFGKMMSDLKSHAHKLAEKVINTGQDKGGHSYAGISFPNQEQLSNALSDFGVVDVHSEEDKLIKTVVQLTNPFQIKQNHDSGFNSACESVDMRSTSTSWNSEQSPIDWIIYDQPPGLGDLSNRAERDSPSSQTHDLWPTSQDGFHGTTACPTSPPSPPAAMSPHCSPSPPAAMSPPPSPVAMVSHITPVRKVKGKLLNLMRGVHLLEDIEAGQASAPSSSGQSSDTLCWSSRVKAGIKNEK